MICDFSFVIVSTPHTLSFCASAVRVFQLSSLDALEAVLGGKEDQQQHAQQEGVAGVSELRRLLALLEEGYGIGPEWVQFDFTVVRGLAYYTGTVFEAFDKKGELRAICGGGRYDNLLQSMGGAQTQRIPAVGFGFGDAVVVELLRDRGLLPDLEAPAVPLVDVVVYAMEEGLRHKATRVAAALRDQGVRVDVILDARKPKWVLQRASRSGATALVMLASEEDSRGEVVVKNLRAHTQTSTTFNSCTQTVKEIIGGSILQVST